MRFLQGSLFRKISVGFVAIILSMMAFIIFSNSNFNNLLMQYNLALENNKKLNEFFDGVKKSREHLRYFSIYNISASEYTFLEEYNNSFKRIESMKTYIDDEYGYGKLIDLGRMMRSYGEVANEVIYYHAFGNYPIMYTKLEESERINMLIQSRYAFFSDIFVKTMESKRQALLQAKEDQNIINIIAATCLTAFCAFIAVILVRSLLKPIRDLAESAEQVSQGNFDIPFIEVNSKDEVALLVNTFNEMVVSIKQYINEREQKAILQESLMEEKNKNLRTEALLRQTQLNALQDRINPHFLFNTLNIIKQTAYLENAQETREMIETTASLLRFYLDKSDMSVLLSEELEYVAEYIFIQEKRFGGRIHFDMHIDENMTNLVIPGLIIQPILENAIIHGLENCMDDGKVEIRVEEKTAGIRISVRDNGKGMSEETINDIMKNNSERKTNGIGIRSVIKRLQLFFDSGDLLSISSTPGEYTHIEISLPKNYTQGGIHSVQAVDC